MHYQYHKVKPYIRSLKAIVIINMKTQLSKSSKTTETCLYKQTNSE